MSKTVLVVITTKAQEFPLGTVEGKFRFAITDAVTNAELSFVETESTGATFPLVPEGSYIASVVKNGVSVSAPFTVAKTVETFQVPGTITVTLS